MINWMNDVSYKEVKKAYDKSVETNKKLASNSKEGGYLDKVTEKRYQIAIKAWKEVIIDNKNKSVNVDNLNKITIDTLGDISKASAKFVRTMRDDYHNINKLFAKIKGDKNKNAVNNITNYSWMSLYIESVDFLTNPKYVAAFKKAFKYYNENKNKPIETDIIYLFIMCNQIITFFIMYSFVLNRESEVHYLNDLNKFFNVTEYAKNIEDIQKDHRASLANLLYGVIELLGFLKSVKDPVGEIDKSIKLKKEAIKNIKSAESLELTERMKIYRDLSDKSYLVDKSFDFNSRGSEEAITVLLIVLGSLVGFIALIGLIKRCIYLIGTLKIDILKYIMIDEETVKMNIIELEERRDKTDNPKEKAKLEKIIEKQKKWADKFSEMTMEMKEIAKSAAYEIDDQMEEDESYILQETNESETGNSDNSNNDGDFTIIM